MKTLPALLPTVVTAVVFAPFSAEIAVSLFAAAGVLAVCFCDYRRPAKSLSPAPAAALSPTKDLPLAA